MHLLSALKHASNAALSMLRSATHMTNLCTSKESMVIYPVIHFCKFLLLPFCFLYCMFTNEMHAHAAENVWSHMFICEHGWTSCYHCFDLFGCLPFTTSMNPYRNFKYTHPHPSSMCACLLLHKEHLNLVTACFLTPIAPWGDVLMSQSVSLAVWSCSEIMLTPTRLFMISLMLFMHSTDKFADFQPALLQCVFLCSSGWLIWILWWLI